MNKRFVFICIVFLVTIAATLSDCGIHLWSKMNSMINLHTIEYNPLHEQISDKYLEAVVSLHQSDPSFARRPFTTLLIKKISEKFNISQGLSFIITNFSLLFLCGILVAYLGYLSGTTLKQCIASIILFYGSFTVMFSFFPPIYSYDEPMQYFFLLLTIAALIKRKWIFFVIAFTGGMIARETSIILVPGFVYFIYKIDLFKNKSAKYFFPAIITGIPVLFYTTYYLFCASSKNIPQYEQNEFLLRSQLIAYNFQDADFSIETIISLFLAVGLQFFLSIVHRKKSGYLQAEKLFIKAFLITLILNSILVVFTSKAREARLFALPLIFIWHLSGYFFYSVIEEVKIKIKHFRFSVKSSLFFIIINVLNYYLVMKCYNQTDGIARENFFREYLFILLFFITFFLTLHKTNFSKMFNLFSTKNNQL